MAEDIGIKIGYGRGSSIDPAIEAGRIDTGDMVVTSDSHEFIFLAPDGSRISCKSRVPTFASIEDAEEYAKRDPAAYVGEIVNIYREDVGAFFPHTLALAPDGSLKVCDPSANLQGNITWQEL